MAKALECSRAPHPEGANPPSDPWAELQIEALWAHRQQLDLPGVIKFLLASLNSLERQGLRPHAVLIEDAANGQAVCLLLKRQLPGLIAIPPKGSKASRAHAVAPLVEAGQVRFARKADSLIEELLASHPEEVWTTRWMPSAKASSGSRPSSGGAGATARRRCRWCSPGRRWISSPNHSRRPQRLNASSAPHPCLCHTGPLSATSAGESPCRSQCPGPAASGHR